MIPGEIIPAKDVLDLECNVDLPVVTLKVSNRGDRPIQVGSHYHFAEANDALDFSRKNAHGHRLNIPAGTAIRFEPGDTREVELVPYRGQRMVHGFHGKVNGPL